VLVTETRRFAGEDICVERAYEPGSRAGREAAARAASRTGLDAALRSVEARKPARATMPPSATVTCDEASRLPMTGCSLRSIVVVPTMFSTSWETCICTDLSAPTLGVTSSLMPMSR
jgi:hypothetical protein